MKFRLEPYTTPSSRYQCPRCNHRNKTFVRYINTETGDHVAPQVGRCALVGVVTNKYHCCVLYIANYFKSNPGLLVTTPTKANRAYHHSPTTFYSLTSDFGLPSPPKLYFY